VRTILRHLGQEEFEVQAVGLSMFDPLVRRTGKGSHGWHRPPQPSGVSLHSTSNP
jgi:hypothetical protein